MAEITDDSRKDFSLSCAGEYDASSCSVSEFTIMASIKAPFFELVHRAAIDLVTVIDRSGSMQGPKIALVLDTLGFVIRQLQSKDRLAVVTYDNTITTTLSLTNMNSTGKEFAQSKVSSIVTGDTTDLCGGLMAGINIVSSRSEGRNEVASVLLFTDGLANIGFQKTEEILREMSTKDPLPCTVYTFGFGADHDATMLKAISDKGNGVYAFVNNKDNIADAFADCLGGLLSVVAQNITLELMPLNGVTISKVRTSYKHQSNPSGSYTIFLGDIQSEEERDLLINVTLPEASEPGLVPVFDLKFSYFDVIHSIQQEKSVTYQLHRDNSIVPTSNLLVDRQKNRILTADALTTAKSLGDAGNIAEARSIINTTIQKLESSATASHEYVLALIKDLRDCMASLRDKSSYNNYGSQIMATYSSSHANQRATYSVQAYSTSTRSTMRSRLDED